MPIFETQRIDKQTSKIIYIGKVTNNGIWLIKKIDKTNANDIKISFATEYNYNKSKKNFIDAWNNKESLIYSDFFSLNFGV